MAKEFKEFDKMFSKYDLRQEKDRWLSQYGTYIKGADHTLERWSLMVQSWDPAFIRQSVYLADDAVDWQKFRVSMKGSDTYDKIRMLLARYWVMCVVFKDEGDHGDWKTEKCRIDNYIGALVRGGQLSPAPEYKVLK